MKDENLFWDFRVYIPEVWAFRQKDSPACRTLLEDLAVLDRSGKKILAGRGKRFESPLPEACWEEYPGRTLLAEDAGCFLLFPELYPKEGLVLALYLSYPAEEVSFVLNFLGRSDFAGTVGKSGAEEGLFDLLSEVLFYLDGLLLAQKSLPLWTIILRAANFAGCKLKKASFPIQRFCLNPSETALLLSFLICFFLSVRRSGGTAKADATETDAVFHIRISALQEDKEIPLKEIAPFLDCKSFRRFRLFREGSKNAILLPLQSAVPRVSSGKSQPYFCVLLECDDREKED